MSSVLIIAKEVETSQKLQLKLSKWGFDCIIANLKDKIAERVIRNAPELVLLEMNGMTSQAVLRQLTDGSKIKRKLPVMALMSDDTLNQPNDYLDVDDFVVVPYDDRELVARARRLIQKNSRQDEILRCEDLVMTWLTAKCG
jgi:DNA-binding response OmpR family regulator